MASAESEPSKITPQPPTPTPPVPPEVVEKLTQYRQHARQNLDPTLIHFPREPKALRNWVNWAFQPRHKRNGEWAITKVPYQARPNGLRVEASSTDPNTWRSLEDAHAPMQLATLMAIGFMFKGSGYIGVDFDHVLTGGRDLPLWADKIMEELGPTYTEYSVRGEGLHCFLLGTTPHTIKQLFSDGTSFELYSDDRYFCVTGKLYPDAPSSIAPCDGKSFYGRFQQGQFGPDDFRAQQAVLPPKDPDGPKRHEDVESFLEKYKVPHGKPRKTKNFTSWDVDCPDPNCSAKNAYVMQHSDGGAGMGCYHETYAYSKRLWENDSYDKWNKFKAHWIAKRDSGAVNGKASSSVFDGPTPARFNWPAPLADEAFHGVAGEVVRMIAPHTEADPAALLTQFLADLDRSSDAAPAL